MGDETVVYLEFGEGGAHTLVATTSGMRQLGGGASVVARIPERTVHVFDRRSGRALHNRRIEEEAVADVRGD
jgi:multiple sugar transport system ATP-binding protein